MTNKKAELNKNMAKSTGKFSFPFLSLLLLVGLALMVFTDDYKELGETLIWLAVAIMIILLVVVIGLMAVITLVIGYAMKDEL